VGVDDGQGVEMLPGQVQGSAEEGGEEFDVFLLPKDTLEHIVKVRRVKSFLHNTPSCHHYGEGADFALVKIKKNEKN
jgi:hypothetical protein